MLITILVLIGLAVLGTYYANNRPFDYMDRDEIITFIILSVAVTSVLTLVWCIGSAFQPTQESLRNQAEKEVWSNTPLPNNIPTGDLSTGDGEHSFEVLYFGESENGKKCTSFISWDGSRYVTTRNYDDVKNVNLWRMDNFSWEPGNNEVGTASWKRTTDSVSVPITSVDANGSVSTSYIQSFNTYYTDTKITGIPDVACSFDDYPSLKEDVLEKVDIRYEELLKENGM